MVVGIAATDAVVHPDAVSLIAIRALVARLAMLRTRWLDNLAVGAKLAAWKLLEQLTKLEHALALSFFVCANLTSGNIAWISSHSKPEDDEEFDADQTRRHHEIVDIQNWLDDDNLCDQDVEKEDTEEYRRALVTLNRHQR